MSLKYNRLFQLYRLYSMFQPSPPPTKSSPPSPFPRARLYRNMNSQHLQATLICERQGDGSWSSNLCHFIGMNMFNILGKHFKDDEQLPLFALLPARIQAEHQKKMSDILDEGQASPYWNALFSNMLNRTIKIRNPVLDEPRFVKIIMTPKVQLENHYQFEILLIDETSAHLISQQEYQKSHDIRALMRYGIKSITENQMTKVQFLEKAHLEVDSLYEHVHEQEEHLIELMDNVMQLSSSNSHKTPHDDHLSSLEFLQIDTKINAFLEELNLPNLRLSITGTTTLYDSYKNIELCISIIKQVLELAIKYGISEVYLHHRSEQKLYICDLLFSHSVLEFALFNPETLKALHHEKGSLEILSTQQLILEKPTINTALHDLSCNFDEIDAVCHEFPNIGVILLVDDLFLNLKLLFKTCMQYIKVNKKIDASGFEKKSLMLNQSSWMMQKILIQKICPHLLFVFCMNADIAIEIIKKIRIHGMITDMEMPGDNNGQDLILWLKAFEQRKQKESIPVILNTALTEREYQEKCLRLIQLNTSYLCKGSSNRIIQEFMNSIIEQITSFLPPIETRPSNTP